MPPSSGLYPISFVLNFLDLSVVAVIATLAVSAFVRSAIGFGDALIAMGLITHWISLKTATPLVALLSMAISSSIVLTEWKQLNFRDARPLILSTLLGIPLGLLLLTVVPEKIAKLFLGILLILYGLYGLVGLKLPRVTSDRSASVFGFLAGILGGAYNTNGPPVVIYGTLRRWNPERFRLTLQGYFFATNVLILAGHFAFGLWTRKVWGLFFLSLPAVGLATWLGGIVNHHIRQDLFAKLVFGVLLVVGVVFLWG